MNFNTNDSLKQIERNQSKLIGTLDLYEPVFLEDEKFKKKKLDNSVQLGTRFYRCEHSQTGYETVLTFDTLINVNNQWLMVVDELEKIARKLP